MTGRESPLQDRDPDGFLVCPKCGGKLTRPRSSMIRGFWWACSKADCSGWASDERS